MVVKQTSNTNWLFLPLNLIFGYYDAKWALHLLKKRILFFLFYQNGGFS